MIIHVYLVLAEKLRVLIIWPNIALMEEKVIAAQRKLVQFAVLSVVRVKNSRKVERSRWKDHISSNMSPLLLKRIQCCMVIDRGCKIRLSNGVPISCFEYRNQEKKGPYSKVNCLREGWRNERRVPRKEQDDGYHGCSRTTSTLCVNMKLILLQKHFINFHLPISLQINYCGQPRTIILKQQIKC